jgi:hypothetical protein
MYNWVMMYEESNLRYLSKTGRVCKRINGVYEVLQDQLIDEFGINEDLLKIIKNKIKIEILYADQIETGDKSTGWKIEFLELDNQELMSKQTKTDFYLQTFEIQKHLPYKIDTKKMSIFEYYKNMKIIANKMKHEK